MLLPSKTSAELGTNSAGSAPLMLCAVAWVQAVSPSVRAHTIGAEDCVSAECVSTRADAQTRVATVLAEEVGGESPQYICADNAERTQCPTVAAQLGASPLNLTIPANARWLFEGPSYMQEVYDTLVAANGGCDSARHQLHQPTTENAAKLVGLIDEREQQGGKACRLPSGAVVGYLNGEMVPDWVRNEVWTHGFFMQPHNKKYRTEHERAAAERDDADEKKFADTQGKDMCLPQEAIYEVDTYQGNGTSFDAYVDCMRAHSQSAFGSSFTISGFESLLPDAASLVLFVPWHVRHACMARVQVHTPDSPNGPLLWAEGP